MKLLLPFEAEELLAEIIDWWDSMSKKIPAGQTRVEDNMKRQEKILQHIEMQAEQSR
jgi:hypothetical protein